MIHVISGYNPLPIISKIGNERLVSPENRFKLQYVKRGLKDRLL